jgi:hypothetical protein
MNDLQPSDDWAPRSRSQEPQYGQPPQFGAPAPQQPYIGQPSQPPKKSHKGRNIAFGIGGGIVALFVIAGIAGGGKSTGSTAASSSTTKAASPTGQDSYTTVPLNPQPTSAAPTTAAAKTVVLKVSGNGIKDTKTFSISSTDYSVAYTYDCSSFGTSGNFIADVQSSDMGTYDSIANVLGAKGSDVSYQHDGPLSDVYVSVNSECSWTVTVTDGDNG